MQGSEGVIRRDAPGLDPRSRGGPLLVGARARGDQLEDRSHAERRTLWGDRFLGPEFG